ncbi:orotate phosphoribosyltransferase [Teladorsagia circumcincta]|uniref:Uridine 5'-monophosphate synthase n=1 Tax=Teladorsagia circumcincta TaxID=45464 RepID=A0A2G9UWQ2_TELCI|nr:orotate phosphoribosyltransferase [Teladorsagia circumcincta]
MNLLVEQSLNGARQRNLLRSMLNSKVFKFGEFVLKSGLKSPIYIDLRECFGYSDLMDLASDGLKSLIEEADIPFDGIVGVPYAALPYATLVSQRSKKPLLIIRKEAKAHGTKKMIEGLYKKGDRVVIIEDVVTTGGSVEDVVKTLRADGLIVEDVFCLLDREQGGAEKLSEGGITLHSLFNMETILCFLLSVDAIDKETSLEIIKDRLPLEERAKEAMSSLNKKVFELMIKKNSNLCLAVDYTEAEKILQLVEKAGPFVVAVKIHADAVVDFSTDFTTRLVRMANDHDFIIFEDRKFGDTGNTNLLQLKGALHVAEWADVVTVHAVQGCDSIGSVFRQVILDPAYRLSGILLIAQLSTKGSLTALPGYTEAAAEMGGTNRDVVCGFICQARVSPHPDMLHWTPGVNLDSTSDNKGQQWRGVDEAVVRQQNDIVIVGRGVTSSANPIQELTRYREQAWAALVLKS